MSPQLIVADIDLSIDFYTKKLGFEIEFRDKDFYAGIIKDGWSIHLKSGSPSIEERQRRRNNEDADIIFSVDSIDKLYDSFLNKKLEIVQALRSMPYGKEIYIADPDGYIIGFLEGE